MRDDLDIPMPAMGPASSGAGYRVPRQREGLDPNTRRLAMIAAAIGGTLVVVLGAWSFTGGRRGGVPVVEADTRPVREKPANAGGMQVAGKDEMIMSGKGDGQAALAPAAEAPAPEALRAQERTAATAAPAATNAAPSVAAGPAATASARTAVAARPVPSQPQAAPAATTRPGTAVPVAPSLATPAPVQPAIAAAAPPAAVTAAKPGGTAQVQFAAVGSEQAAMQEWQRIEKKAPGLLGGHKPVVSKTEHDGKTFWRLRTNGFADATAAKSFCEQVKAKGLTCTVTAL